MLPSGSLEALASTVTVSGASVPESVRVKLASGAELPEEELLHAPPAPTRPSSRRAVPIEPGRVLMLIIRLRAPQHDCAARTGSHPVGLRPSQLRPSAHAGPARQLPPDRGS